MLEDTKSFSVEFLENKSYPLYEYYMLPAHPMLMESQVTFLSLQSTCEASQQKSAAAFWRTSEEAVALLCFHWAVRYWAH